MNRIESLVVAAATTLTTITCITAVAPPAMAAGVRVAWQHEGQAHYEIYVGQEADNGQHFVVHHVGAADAAVGGEFRAVVRGIQPLRTAFFVMVAVDGLGRASGPSRILGIAPEDFCMAFDVDNDGRVSALDVLVILQRVVDEVSADDVTVTDAYEMLRLAGELTCEARLDTGVVALRGSRFPPGSTR